MPSFLSSKHDAKYTYHLLWYSVSVKCVHIVFMWVFFFCNLKMNSDQSGWTAWPLNMRTIECSETSVRNYRYPPSKISERRRSKWRFFSTQFTESTEFVFRQAETHYLDDICMDFRFHSITSRTVTDGRLGSRLRGYHPVAPGPLKYGPFVHRL
jgi:hypothetical protein